MVCFMLLCSLKLINEFSFNRTMGFWFTKNEINDLLIALVLVSLAFTIAQIGVLSIFSLTGIVILIFSLITAGIGFLLHELGHKFVAQHYKAVAHFVADKKMLMFGLIISLFGMIFLAPGAVVISQVRNIRHLGPISLAGPVVNFMLAFVFLILNVIFPFPLWFYGAYINSFLGLFNMIPFGPFDGKKILSWNKIIYGVTVAVGFILIFFSGLMAF